MKRRFTEEQIIGVLREQEAGGVVKEITRRHGISECPAGKELSGISHLCFLRCG